MAGPKPAALPLGDAPIARANKHSIEKNTFLSILLDLNLQELDSYQFMTFITKTKKGQKVQKVHQKCVLLAGGAQPTTTVLWLGTDQRA